METLSNFSERLQELMFENNIKPNILHQKTKINLGTIYTWLRNETLPTMNSSLVLSDFFSCSLDFLSGRSNKNYFSPQNSSYDFPTNLRAILSKNNISVLKFSKETKIPRSAINYWLAGRREPLLDNLIRLANYLDCTIDYLVGRE